MLKIFTSYTPGAGKSYLMLQSALEEKSAGKEVIIGFLNGKHRDLSEWSFQNEIEDSSVRIKYKGDVERIVREKPDIVVLDEMGMRIGKNAFVYNVIEELLQKGITVYTSANLKRFSSINPLFRKITGIGIKTTIPDYFLDIAEEIVFIDREPERMAEDFMRGTLFEEKYASSRVMQKNFRLDNLIAYRNISMEYLKKYNQVRIVKRD